MTSLPVLVGHHPILNVLTGFTGANRAIKVNPVGMILFKRTVVPRMKVDARDGLVANDRSGNSRWIAGGTTALRIGHRLSAFRIAGRATAHAG